eukprot:6383148-Amphidinium_carterae.1
MHGEQNNDPMSDMVRMTRELIASIQTSADGVTTETMTMQRTMVVQHERLNEHIASVPSSLMTGVRQAQRTQRWHKSHEEATKIATLTAKTWMCRKQYAGFGAFCRT